MPVEVAIALSVGTNYAQMYIQHPKLGVIDGVKVCVCDSVSNGSCGDTCDWHSLHADVHIIMLTNLSPGSQYQLGVYSTSREQTGPPYYTRPIRTSQFKHVFYKLLCSLVQDSCTSHIVHRSK